MFQTFVVKVEGADPSVLRTDGQERIASGRAHAFASVEIAAGQSEGHYLVMTLATAVEENSFAAGTRKQLLRLPGAPQVQWARPLTRYLHCILGWADVQGLQPSDPLAPTCSWQQHLTHPLPFFVVDQQKVPEADKLAWVKRELGEDATLPEFASMFLQLFGAKLKDMYTQKHACLKLFCVYSEGCTWKKEVDIPPMLLTDFQRVWDPQVGDRCFECGKLVDSPAGSSSSLRGVYCSNTCRDAGFVVRCNRCTPERKCGFCSMEAAPASASRLDNVLRENALQLKRARSMYGHETRTADPDHEAAWKKRRRS